MNVPEQIFSEFEDLVWREVWEELDVRAGRRLDQLLSQYPELKSEYLDCFLVDVLITCFTLPEF